MSMREYMLLIGEDVYDYYYYYVNSSSRYPYHHPREILLSFVSYFAKSAARERMNSLADCTRVM